MPEFLPCLVPLFIALVVAAIVWAFYAQRKRRQELAAWAASRGLSFSSEDDPGMDARLPAFECLRRGHGRCASNIMEGPWGGRSILAFDYRYTTGSGKNRTTHCFSAVVLFSPVPLKPLHLRPENFLDGLAAFFGFDDIDFESAEFSRRYHVKAPDRKWAYDVLHARAIEFLLGRPEHSLQFDLDRVMAWRDATFSAVEFEQAARLIEGLLEGLPEYLVRQQLGETGPREDR